MDQEMLKNRPRTAVGQLTLTVGQDAGDLKGCDDKVLQAGVDYLHRLGGGILDILPGTYAMHNALYMRPNVTVRGAGQTTILLKTPSVCTDLVFDSDWYEARVRLQDVSGFTPGGGIMLRAYKDDRLVNVVQATVTAIDGDVVALDKRLLKNFWVGDRATAATLFPVLTAQAGTCDVCVENLVLDGNWAQNDEINGNYAGAMFIQECDRFAFRHVTARNYHGDGFSFQVCDDIQFEHCRAENNESRGYHPGSGSQRPVFDACVATGNTQGIFFCWGVSDGLVKGCICSQNHNFGISIGHRDTDNRIVASQIEGNGKVGILFREPNTEFRGGHRNEISDCVIRDNGSGAVGIGVDINGLTCNVIIRNNEIVDSGHGVQAIGVRIGAEVEDTLIEENTFSGQVTEVEDLRTVFVG
ncbi:MAG: hypothetical protein ACI8V2_002385 [Candidatus Latescibacterota bacterium]|jgi:hypothetical protein